MAISRRFNERPGARCLPAKVGLTRVPGALVSCRRRAGDDELNRPRKLGYLYRISLPIRFKKPNPHSGLTLDLHAFHRPKIHAAIEPVVLAFGSFECRGREQSVAPTRGIRTHHTLVDDVDDDLIVGL